MRRGGSSRSASGIHPPHHSQYHHQHHGLQGAVAGTQQRASQATTAAATAAATVNVTFDRRISEADAYLVLLLEQQQAFEARYKTLRSQMDSEAKRRSSGKCCRFVPFPLTLHSNEISTDQTDLFLYAS